jgi:DNA replication protein DnaC
MNTSDLDIDALLKRLHLANARRTWRDLVTRAETEAWSCRDFLALLAAEEVAHRQQTRIQRVSSRCGFPFLKTIDDFDFTYQSTVKLALLGSALSPDFVTDGRSLILHGKPGRGKTHIARRHRLSRDPERLRHPIRHRRRAHRGPLGCLA